MSYLECNGTQLYYKIVGEGIPTVIIHGWGVDHRLMSGCLEPVFAETKAQFKRIYIDLPGMGKSAPGAAVKDAHDILHVVYALLETIIPNEPYLLMGESFGGYLCRGILKEHPNQVLGLLLLCPLVIPGYRKGNVVPHKIMETDEAFLSSLTKEEYDSFSYLNVRLTKEVWERYSNEIQSGLLLQDTDFLGSVLDGSFHYEVDQLEAPYEGPALFITGKQDTEVGYIDQFELQKHYINGTYVAIAGCGHNAQIEQPEMFTGIAKGWLDTYFH